jgi:hypothetical protein
MLGIRNAKKPIRLPTPSNAQGRTIISSKKSRLSMVADSTSTKGKRTRLDTPEEGEDNPEEILELLRTAQTTIGE